MADRKHWICSVVRAEHTPLGAGKRPDGRPRVFVLVEVTGENTPNETDLKQQEAVMLERL